LIIANKQFEKEHSENALFADISKMINQGRRIIAIIIFIKTGAGGTDKVWFYDMQSDGYSLDDKRNPIEQSDISDIVARFQNLADEESRARIE